MPLVRGLPGPYVMMEFLSLSASIHITADTISSNESAIHMHATQSGKLNPESSAPSRISTITFWWYACVYVIPAQQTSVRKSFPSITNSSSGLDGLHSRLVVAFKHVAC